jgi:DNA-directed RNA polymerase subunit RPC12/RpoP
MYKMRRKIRKRNVRRRASIHSLIWLVGLVVLAITDWWWPGILVLVIISVLLETVGKRGSQSEAGEELPEPIVEEKPVVMPPSPSHMETVAPMPEVHRAEWLPLSCPKCGAPTRAGEVHWTGDSSAACPYCGSNLPLKKA